jgi:thioredoxin reductase
MTGNKRVCVIGAGAAGLTTARALLEVGVEVVVLEQRTSIGGIWNRDAAAPDCENPVYDGLGVNLPIELMAFWDVPFERSEDECGSFVSHTTVQLYLERYADVHDLQRLVRFGTKVLNVERQTGGNEGGWLVESVAIGDPQTRRKETFDAVVVCSGHYATPFVPEFAGRADFEAGGGRVLHAALYRSPTAYASSHVLIVGSGPSGNDIAIELAEAGASVVQSIRGGAATSNGVLVASPHSHIAYAGAIERLHADRTATLVDPLTASTERVGPFDGLILATGYDYAFPFLDASLLGGGARAVTRGAGEATPREATAATSTALPPCEAPKVELPPRITRARQTGVACSAVSSAPKIPACPCTLSSHSLTAPQPESLTASIERPSRLVVCASAGRRTSFPGHVPPRRARAILRGPRM